jgi:D-alanine-D-alanine ligase
MFCLEANTLPGMTPTSLLPQEAKVIGMSFSELCEKIMEISMRRYRK